jgi:hypothetical protein
LEDALSAERKKHTAAIEELEEKLKQNFVLV